MGTTYKVIMIDGNQKEADIFKILNSVNNEMSTYIESSTISILNKSEIGKWVNVSNNFIKVASFSKKICDETNGAFNIGLGHFVNYYGFGPPREMETHNVQSLKKLSNEISCSIYEIDKEKKRIKRTSDVYLDMSGIAKGFAIDLLSSYLDSKYVKSYFIELGGEIKFKGKKENNEPWLIAIENPKLLSSPIVVLSSKNYLDSSIATSGEYRNFLNVNGNIVSHTIDPKSFKPIKNNHLSVSVISKSAMKADALATALNVMGEREGLEYSNDNQLISFFLVNEKGEISLKSSKWF